MYNLYDEKKVVDLLFARGEIQNDLFEKARAIRKKHFNNKVYVRAVIELSNYCRCNCKFCGNAAYVKSIDRYRVDYESVKEQIDNIKTMGIDVIHFASGEDMNFDFEMLCKLIEYISSKDMYTELALGKLDIFQYQKLKKAGAKRYIIKFETSNSKILEQIKPCSTLNEILEIIHDLNKLGYDVGTGNMIGIPGQTINDIVNDLNLINQLDLSMSSTSVFIPNNDSLMKNELPGDTNIALNYLALLRIIKGSKNLSIPTNSTFGKEGKLKALEFAANELSLNMTPISYANKYSLYEGKDRKKSNEGDVERIICKTGLEKSTLGEMIYGKNSSCYRWK